MDRVSCIVAGAGIVGLAIARELAARGREVIVIEAESSFGTHTSSRNNEVIHAGFLYPPGSLKARLCRKGCDALYSYCAERGIPHRRVGKLMIATSEEEREQLLSLMDYGAAAGVGDLEVVDCEHAKRLEPNLHCVAAILSPSTGIVDTHSLMLSLLGDLERSGGQLAFQSRITRATLDNRGIVLDIAISGSEAYRVACDVFVNAAGLGAEGLHRSLFGDAPRIHFAKGNFFGFSGNAPFERMIVPVGETLSRGGSFTFDTGGQGKFGPDLEWVDSVDYRVDPKRVHHVIEAIRRYYPDISADALAPAYSGIRPRASKDGVVSDWIIEGETRRGAAGVVTLLGIDTPGITGALAIGEHVAELLRKSGE